MCEALGEEAVDRVADAGRQEQHEGNPHGARRRDRPDHDRHQQNAPQRNEIRNTQGNPGSRRAPASGAGNSADPSDRV